jgi:hypothetical protein
MPVFGTEHPGWNFSSCVGARCLSKDVGLSVAGPRDPVAGKTDYDLFPEAHAKLYRENDLKVLRAGYPLEFEELVPQDDGTHT